MKTYHPTIREFFPDDSAVKKWEADHGMTLGQFEAKLGQREYVEPRKIVTKATVAKMAKDSQLNAAQLVAFVAELQARRIEVL